MKTNKGYDIQALQMGGGSLVGMSVDTTGTCTGITATSMTDSAKDFVGTAVGGVDGTEALVGRVLVVYDAGIIYSAVITEVASTHVLHVDQWTIYNSDAAATPSNTSVYRIMNHGGAAANKMALSTNTSTVLAGDTLLPAEITTSGGGLIRKRVTWAHTTGVGTYSLSATFTANGSDSLPVTVAKIGIGAHFISGFRCLFQTLLPSTSTLTTVGDQITVTDTVDMT